MDNEKFVIFYLDKETMNFKSYQVIDNKEEQELINGIKRHNADDSSKRTAYLITDQHVIDAILQKESKESIRSVAKEFQESVDEIRDSISYLENKIEEIKDLAK